MTDLAFTLNFEKYRIDYGFSDAHKGEAPLSEMALEDLLYEIDRDTLQWLVIELPFSDHLVHDIHQYDDSELIEWLLGEVESKAIVFFKKEQTHYRPAAKPQTILPPSPPPQKPKPAATARIKQDPPEKAQKSTETETIALAHRRGVFPESLETADERLESMKALIKSNGYQPKYNDAELQQQAQFGDVSQERFHVRVIESRHKYHRHDTKRSPDNFTGALGLPMKGETGTGAKYWSTTFDQLEDADKDPRLICEKLGLDYNPKKTYELAIIDTHKAKTLAKTKSVPATFKKVAKFSNEELPDVFPKAFTDEVMNEEFQAFYAEHHANAVRSGALESAWDVNPKSFNDYLETTDLSSGEKELLLIRFEMHKTVGNNQYYLGNGLTENKIASCSSRYGAVETLNFERKEINLQQFKDAGALKLVTLG